MGTYYYEELLSPSCALKLVAASTCKTFFSVSATPILTES